MTIQINYKKISSKKDLANLVLFVDEKFNINNLKKYLSNLEFSYISDLLKNSDLKKDLLSFVENSDQKIVTKGINSSPSFTFENVSLEGYTEPVTISFVNSLPNTFYPSFFPICSYFEHSSPPFYDEIWKIDYPFLKNVFYMNS